MIDALIAGKLFGTPKLGQGKNGPYTTAMVRVATVGGDSLMCSVIAFADSAQTALQALGEGEAVSLAGTLTPKVYEARDGTHRPSLDMVAHAVLTAYQVKRRRQVVQGDGDE